MSSRSVQDNHRRCWRELRAIITAAHMLREILAFIMTAERSKCIIAGPDVFVLTRSWDMGVSIWSARLCDQL